MRPSDILARASRSLAGSPECGFSTVRMPGRSELEIAAAEDVELRIVWHVGSIPARPWSCLILLVIGVVLFANGAAALTLSAESEQTIDGEDFSFDFNGLVQSDGSDGGLTIRARGDYGVDNPTEFLGWSLDSGATWTLAGPVLGGTTIIVDNGINDVEWSQTFAISGADLVALTSGGGFSVLVDLNLDGESLGVNCCFSQEEFVAVSVSYTPIPEPSRMLLSTGGIVSVAWMRFSWRRRRFGSRTD